jgi:type IV secretion system protein VirB5
MKPTIELKRFAKGVSGSTGHDSGDQPHDLIQRKPEPYNPYLAARREWDERYGDLLARVKMANRIALICGGVALLLASVAGALALRGSKVILIPVDPAGHYIGPGSPAQPMVVSESMKRSALSDWVMYLRTITSDDISQRWAIEKVYAMISSGSSAQTFVSDFYRSDPPQMRAQRVNVHIEVNSILPTSDTTYEVEWLETTRDLGGRVVSQQRWKGIFTFVIRGAAPPDERLARLNPFGLFVTSANWSKVL